MDKVILKGVKVKSMVGWYHWEQKAPREIILDLEIGIPSQKASQSDELADTIDYAAVVNYLRTELQQRKFMLIEKMGDYVAHVLLQNFHASWARVRVIKPGILEDVAEVSVEIERSN